jgi:hypothetical protein
MGLQLSGSVQLEGNLLVTGSANSVFENISVTNRITANEINVQFVSSSIIYSSGSNRFGDEITDNHQFTGSVDVSGSVTATNLVRRGGTSSQFLMADGSVNTSVSASGAYLPLTGGTLTGALNGTSAVFSSTIRSNSTNGLGIGDIAGYRRIQYDNSLNTFGFLNDANSLGNIDALAASFSNSVTASAGLINGTTDAFFDLNRSASGNASRVRFQTVGTDEFEIGLKGGVPGFHITNGAATELLTISGSNVGIGIIPNTWAGTNTKALQVYLGSMAASLTFGTAFTFNSHYDGNWRYIGSYSAGKYDIGGNEHIWYSAPSGTAGDTISFVETMKLTSTGRLGLEVSTPDVNAKLHIADPTNGFVGLRLSGSGDYTGTDWTIYASSTSPNSADDFLGFYNNSTTDSATLGYKVRMFKNGDVNIGNGNLVIGTAGKGIDFSATSNSSGTMTSELLNDYEEGTWTPNDASGAGLSLTVVDARYTKIGRQVQCFASITYPSTANANNAIIGGLPFTSVNTSGGSYGAFIAYTNLGTDAFFLNITNTTTTEITSVAGANITNATVSAKNFRLIWIYEV